VSKVQKYRYDLYDPEKKWKVHRRRMDFAILRNVSLGRESGQNTKLVNDKDMGIDRNTVASLHDV
jgi:hypothetical protein